MCANQISTKEEVLAFWFDEISPEQWFKKDENFDANLTKRAGLTLEKALNGQIDSWAETADGATALVIVLDQFTRNIFRDTPQAFSGDEMALVVSLKSVNRNWFDELPNMHKHFLLMPMMHSEDILIQEKSLRLFEMHTNELTHEYALKHRDIVAKFNRFPHRNAILGRPSTAEELEFLKHPGSSF
mgnify:FL=1